VHRRPVRDRVDPAKPDADARHRRQPAPGSSGCADMMVAATPPGSRSKPRQGDRQLDRASWRVATDPGGLSAVARRHVGGGALKPARPGVDCQAEASGQDGGCPAPRPSTRREKPPTQTAFSSDFGEPAAAALPPTRARSWAPATAPAGPLARLRWARARTPRRAHRPIGGLVAGIVCFAENRPSQRPAARLTGVVGVILGLLILAACAAPPLPGRGPARSTIYPREQA
jgi:hypothetical protein